MSFDRLQEGYSSVAKGFIRQRRNLIVTSLILIVAQYANVEIEQLNFFGNVAKLSRTIPLTLLVWIVFVYFLLRYIQYFHDLDDKSLSNTIGFRFHQTLNGALVRRYAAAYEEAASKFAEAPIAEKVPPQVSVHRMSTFGCAGTVSYYVKIKSDLGEIITKQIGHESFHLLFKDVVALRVGTFIESVVLYRFFTEYYLPLVLAAIAALSPVWTPLFDVMFRPSTSWLNEDV